MAESVRALPPVRLVPIGEVRVAVDNPRVISKRAVELVADSLVHFGWKQPIVLDADGELVAGHTRYLAARRLKLTHLPAIDATDLTPDEADAYRIVDNRTHDFTTWDLTELTKQLDRLAPDFGDVLALADWGIVSAEFDELNQRLLNDLDLPEDVEVALDGGFIVNVCFRTKQQALEAQQIIIDLPGVFDVRHKF